jgi:transposase-like protein
MNNLTLTAGGRPHAGSIRQSFWRDTLAAFAASGQSVQAFCQERGLCVATFYAWRHRLAEREGHGVPAKSGPGQSAQPAFLPVELEPCLPADDSIRVDLRGGRVLRLPASMPAVRVAELVHALEGLA